MRFCPLFSAVLFFSACSATQLHSAEKSPDIRLPSSAASGPRRQIDLKTYEDRLRAMWLAQSIANWTGLLSEGKREEPPFFTDADWGREIAPGVVLDFELETGANVWGSDDDTDVEYVYLQLMADHRGPELSSTQIADGWRKYMLKEWIWVSNLSTWLSIHRGILPPATGLGAVNVYNTEPDAPGYLMIDAQLTTEFFGAIAPGLPHYALKISDLPIRSVATAYAAHAAQHFMLMYSLAPVADPSLRDREKILWLAREARKYIPGTSKTADIFDFVLADFLRLCPAENAAGCKEWTRTRDRVYERYQKNAKANGFHYHSWFESGVNYAGGLIALFYGQGDLKRTIQIGALSGWDSDNGTATMGGLLGLLNGYEWVRRQFPGENLSDKYNVYRTRSKRMPDYLPADPNATDTFALMAQRMLPLISQAVVNAGGKSENGVIHLPALPQSGQLNLSPTVALHSRSANSRFRAAGAKVLTETTGTLNAAFGKLSVIADGLEHDFSGTEPKAAPSEAHLKGEELSATVIYPRPVELGTLRFIEGGRHNNAEGHFTAVTPQVLVNGAWINLPGEAKQNAPITPLPNQIIDWTLPQPMQVSGIRLQGKTAGGFVSIVELDALSE